MNMYFEDAQLNWCKGESDVAMKLMQTILNSETTRFVETRIQAMGIYGEYLAETCTENTETIIRSYLEKSIRMSGAHATQKFLSESSQHQKERAHFDLINRRRNHKAIAKCKHISIFNRITLKTDGLPYINFMNCFH